MGHLAARLKTFSLFFTVVYLLAFLNQEWTQFFKADELVSEYSAVISSSKGVTSTSYSADDASISRRG